MYRCKETEFYGRWLKSHLTTDPELFCVFTHRTDQTVIGCSGFHGDCLTLTKVIDARLKVGVIPLTPALIGCLQLVRLNLPVHCL